MRAFFKHSQLGLHIIVLSYHGVFCACFLAKAGCMRCCCSAHHHLNRLDSRLVGWLVRYNRSSDFVALFCAIEFLYITMISPVIFCTMKKYTANHSRILSFAIQCVGSFLKSHHYGLSQSPYPTNVQTWWQMIQHLFKKGLDGH